MTIRPATESDTPAIIGLLKASLGESMIPKSEALWEWKHVLNPFGRSPVLLAEEDGVLAGVRAFLRWEFVKDGEPVRACRAVDTATHPDFQGKGIFNKLTLELVEVVKKEGVDLVFNTPNSKSTPGYLKMGWERWGKLPLKLDFHFGKSIKQDPGSDDWNSIASLIKKIETSSTAYPGVQTKLVPGYISWRFRDIPLFPYRFLSDGESYLLVYRVKEGKMGKEFRICDLFTAGDLTKTQELNRSLADRIKMSGARFSSFSGLQYSNQTLLEMGMLPVMKIGPLVTLRNVTEGYRALDQPWNWSLGDLEVF